MFDPLKALKRADLGQDREHDERRDAKALGALREPGAERHLYEVPGLPRVAHRHDQVEGPKSIKLSLTVP